MKRTLVLLAVAGSASLGLGCFGDNTATQPDAGSTFDAGVPGFDSGSGPDADASVPVEAATPHDAGPMDAADAADAGPTPQAVLSAMTGGSSMSDFGLQQIGTSSASASVVVSNTGTAPTGALAVTLTGPDAAAFAIDSDGCSGKPLAASATCTVSVHFAPAAAGQATATLAASATPGGSTSIALAGQGVTPGALAITPATKDFGTLTTGVASPTQTFTVSNSGGTATPAVAVALNGANAGDFAISASTCTGPISAGGSCTLKVAFTPSAVGTRTASLAATAGSSVATASLSGTGAVPVLAVTPPSGWTGFGTVDVGSNNSATFVVTNTGPVGTLAAPTVTTSNTTQFHLGAGTMPCTSTLAPGATCNFVLTFSPTAVGNNDTTTLTASVTPGTSVPYTASGSASVSTLQVTGSPFGYVTLGQSAILSYSVTNSGPYPVSAPTVTSSSTDFVPTASCGALAVNQSCSFTVTFKPSTTTAEMATITASAPPNNAGTYTATGQGAVGALGAISAWTAPPTVQGKSNPTTYTIVNDGHGATSPLSISGVTVGTNIFNLQGDTCTGKSLAPNGVGTCTFQVVFAPTVANSTPGQTASATVTVTDTATDTVSAAVSGIPLYSGVYLVISPPTASYGSVTTGQSPSLPFTITNYGTNAAPPFSSIRVVSGANETPSSILYDVGNATTANCPTNNSSNSPPVAGLASLASCSFGQPFDYGQSGVGAFSYDIYPTSYDYTSLGGPGALLSGIGK